MTRFYEKTILLVEFDQNERFHLQGHYMISGESTTSIIDITQKLQLLTIHFRNYQARKQMSTVQRTETVQMWTRCLADRRLRLGGIHQRNRQHRRQI